MISRAELDFREAVSAAPVEAARGALAAAGLTLDRPMKQEQFDALMTTNIPLGYGDFKPGNRHRGPLMDRPVFSLKDITQPASYFGRYLHDLWKTNKIDELEYANAQLYSPVSVLHVGLIDTRTKKPEQQIGIFINPDLPPTAVYDEDLNYIYDQYDMRDPKAPDGAHEYAVVQQVRRAFGDEALHILNDGELTVLTRAIQTTGIVPVVNE